MKLNIPFKELEKLVREMGAPPATWQIEANRLDDLNIGRLLLEGLETNLDDVDVNEDGLLTYKGKGVLLYIKDTGCSKDINENFPEKSRKFHFSDCKTLEKKRKNGTFERYIATIERSGRFKVDYHEEETDERGETEARLKVCKNCLEKINYSNYDKENKKEKKEIFDKFSIGDFFEKYHSNFKRKPRHTDETAPPSGYTRDWDDRSRTKRAQSNWTCAKCRVNLSEHRYCLDTHHKNGVKSDNTDTNLVVLCKLCHADQHSHMKNNSEVANTIRRSRQEQGLT